MDFVYLHVKEISIWVSSFIFIKVCIVHNLNSDPFHCIILVTVSSVDKYKVNKVNLNLSLLYCHVGFINFHCTRKWQYYTSHIGNDHCYAQEAALLKEKRWGWTANLTFIFSLFNKRICNDEYLKTCYCEYTIQLIKFCRNVGDFIVFVPKVRCKIGIQLLQALTDHYYMRWSFEMNMKKIISHMSNIRAKYKRIFRFEL